MSPIKGLTDRVTPAFPNIGKLRKGGEKRDRVKPNGIKYQIFGEELDHFRFTSDRPEVVVAFQEVYGEMPRAVTVFLPYKEVDANFSTWKEAWKEGGMLHRCDGQTMNLWLGPDGKYRTDPKPCVGGCDEVGRLTVIIPQLIQVGFVGYVTMETHSINDILSISASLLAVAETRIGDERGLRGIGFTIRRVSQKISTPASKDEPTKRVRREKWLVKLEPSPDWVRLQLSMAEGMLQLTEANNGTPSNGMSQAELSQETIIESEATLATEQPVNVSQEQQVVPTVGEERPYPPDVTRKKLRDRAEKYQKPEGLFEATVEQKRLYAIMLRQAMGERGDPDQTRHLLNEYVFGRPSTSDLSRAQLRALLDWLIQQESRDAAGNYLVHPAAAQEVASIVRQALTEKGQTELPIEEEEKAHAV